MCIDFDAWNASTGTPVHASLLCDCAESVVEQWEANVSSFAKGESYAMELDWSLKSDFYAWLYNLCLGMLGLAVLVSNLVVIWCILMDKRLHVLHNWLLCGQALSDLSVGLLTTVFCLVSALQDWMVASSIGCQVFGWGIVCTCHSTLFSLSLIAHSRKVRIMDSSSRKPTSLRWYVVYYIVLVWLLPIGLTLCYSQLSSVRLMCYRSFCNPVWTGPTLFLCGVFVAVPIAYTIHAYSCLSNYVVRTTEAASTSTQACSTNVRSRTSRLMYQLSMSILVMWIPLYLYFFLVLLKLITGDEFAGMLIFERLLGFSAVGSSLVSPFLYVYKNRSLRASISRRFVSAQQTPV